MMQQNFSTHKIFGQYIYLSKALIIWFRFGWDSVIQSICFKSQQHKQTKKQTKKQKGIGPNIV